MNLFVQRKLVSRSKESVAPCNEMKSVSKHEYMHANKLWYSLLALKSH